MRLRWEVQCYMYVISYEVCMWNGSIFQCDTFHYILLTRVKYTFRPTNLPCKSSGETVAYKYTYTIRKLEILIVVFGRLINEASFKQ